ncbi:MAG: SMI1/KNR4 family protein [Wohlfahrtiimonas sp.]
MKQNIQQFIKFTTAEFPSFITNEASVYPIQHTIISDSLTQDEIDFLTLKLGNLAPSFIEFYSKINGADLFVGKNHNMPLNNKFSFNLFSVNQMNQATEWLLDWVEEDIAEDGFMESDDELGSSYDGIPPWWSFKKDTALVLAKYEGSAEYIFVVLQGEKRGMIYEFDHDGYRFIPLAKDFNGFINLLINHPMKIMGPYMNSYCANKGGRIIEYKSE